jgi:DivIVA domain-containing protein
LTNKEILFKILGIESGDNMNNNLINLTPEEILNKEFRIDTRGYRLKEVDQFLDEIIADYQAFNKIIRELEEEKANQNEVIMNLKQEIRDLKTTVEISRSAANRDEISGSNLDILKRLSALEKAVYGRNE